MKNAMVQDKKSIRHRKAEMRRLGALCSPGEIPYFKRVALDPKEDISVQKEAIKALGNLGDKGKKPLEEISRKAHGEVARSASALLNALERKDWDQETRTRFQEFAKEFFPLIEEPAR